MGDNQKIHPAVDVEAPAPTASLVSCGLATSEKGGSSLSQRRPPQPLRTVPAVMQSSKPSQTTRSCCCKCICWTVGLLVLLLVVVGATAGILYLVFKPKIPNYSVDSLTISDLRLNFDMSLYAKFDVKITANNPNKKIGIYYEKDGLLSVWYTNTKLCQGSIPKFYQGHQNITKLDVSLTGQTQDGNTLMRALQEQQQTGRIPLDLKIDAPVAIKLGRLKLRKVMILGNCLLVVDSLSTNNRISIKASNCKFRLKL
ncbi:unnamed protein product [Dovyalis caffra]|uniref:Late embryogenesis abundant protein LEA-2 subgroup domain-containing protein n=1 Tax=Dovyalis caffra TaxID=77055 RepID=A0AAV1RT72_9ROSI|nr:unnamed protein product [Dovyalis caffra]